MMIDDDLSVPQQLQQVLEQYRNKVESAFDAYVNKTVKTLAGGRQWPIDPHNPIYAGVSEQFINNTKRDIPNAECANMYVLYKPGQQIQQQCIEWAKQFVEHPTDKQWISGHFYYPSSQGFMGWHTNSNQPGVVIYLTYTDHGGRSFFRYYDNNSEQVITSYDKGGWHGRMFITSNDPNHHFWHCVYSEVDRLSIGIEQQ